MEQLSSCTTTTEPASHKQRVAPTHHNQRKPARNHKEPVQPKIFKINESWMKSDLITTCVPYPCSRWIPSLPLFQRQLIIVNLCVWKLFSRVWFFATPWTVACRSGIGSSVYGILQARILEWVVIRFSRRSSRPRDGTWVSHVAGRFFTVWATREIPLNTNMSLILNTRVRVSYFKLLMGYPDECQSLWLCGSQ